MARYEKLKLHLLAAKFQDVDISFHELETILGRPLPQSAFNHRGFWSNNPDNNVMTRAWLAAGYQTRNVDMKKHTVTFEYIGFERPRANTKQSQAGFEERQSTDFRFDRVFDAAVKQELSPRAKEWMLMNNESDNKKIVIDMIESLASKSRRKLLVDKYSGLNLGSGSDSVDLIRESRDER